MSDPAVLTVAPVAPGPAVRWRIRVRGLVQGVGFRPHVYRIARRWALAGYVLNDADGVLIEAEGSDVPGFVAAIRTEAPPLSRIDAIEIESLTIEGSTGFVIRESEGSARLTTAIGPDAGPCPACLGELFDPSDRRHGYPFINCTDCGPRLTITRRLPYDRRNTTMAAFPLCTPCDAEYRDPASRRFHAEPNACPTCGPRLSHPIEAIADCLIRGGIVALKGMGGYQLACDASNPDAVNRLRQRKQRDGKPFAVMVQGVGAADRLIAVGAADAAILRGPERPILVAPSRPDHGLAEGVTRGLATLGIMLPATPLHYLVFHALAGRPAGTDWIDADSAVALVMTSANMAGDPLVIDDDVATTALADLADLIVQHDRAIVVRADDSVVRMIDGAPAAIRRARGYVPRPIALASAPPPILGVGAHLKASICLTRGAEAHVSQHIGDLDTPATVEFHAAMVEFLIESLQVRPALVAHDLHPDFASTRLAQALGIPCVPVQHHVAHIAAVVAERQIDHPVIGLALDGYGMGPAGEAWGGELIRLEGARWQRLGGLAPLPMPGGDRAAREPWRMAAGVLHALGRGDAIAVRFADEPQARALAGLLAKGGPLVGTTTSLGRAFDAVAALAGVTTRHTYEGEGPMRLESMVRQPMVSDGGFSLYKNTLDLSSCLRVLTDSADASLVADLWHGTLIAGLTAWAASAARQKGLKTVVLAGGCCLNRVLAEGLVRALGEAGLDPVLPRILPPNDGGIALGQVHMAAMAYREGLI